MLQPSQTFAHFRIIRLLGEGGMGDDNKINVLSADY